MHKDDTAHLLDIYGIIVSMSDNIPIISGRKPLVRFDSVGFSWPGDDEIPNHVIFDSFSADIPQGFISVTGPNGSGKTTFLLLAGGRLMPNEGRIELCEHDTRVISGLWKDPSGIPGNGLTPEQEHKRNLICSFLYQNMEFDTGEDDGLTLGSLLEYVFINGAHPSSDEAFFTDVLKTFELEALRGRTLQALSKGELQRTLLSFSALYGSKVIIMDEPVFAMEQYQKERALEFFGDIYRRSGVSIIVSLHELSLTRKYADTVMLFYPDRRIDLGSCDEVLTKEALEAAYGVPEAMLYDSERLARRSLLEADAVKRSQ